MRWLGIGLWFSLAIGLGACGGNTTVECQNAMNSLCDMACDCTSGVACNISYASNLQVFTDRSGCEEYWLDRCDMPAQGLPPASFFSDCADALDETTCLDEGEGSVILPEACVQHEEQ